MRVLNVDTVLCLYKMSAMPRAVTPSAEEAAVRKKKEKGTKTRERDFEQHYILESRASHGKCNALKCTLAQEYGILSVSTSLPLQAQQTRRERRMMLEDARRTRPCDETSSPRPGSHTPKSVVVAPM